MVWWLVVALGAAAVTLGLKLIDERYNQRWHTLSLEARLRDAQIRGDAAIKTLGKLRRDRDEGKLVINEEYAGLFERLTSEGAS